MKIAIIGIGAMGCLFAAHLHDVADVVMVGHWPEQLKALRQNGLIVQQPNGRRTHHPAHATNDPAAAAPADLAVILVKSLQSEQAAHIAQTALAPNGIAITLQNGLGNLETLTAVLGPHRATLGTTSTGADIVQPGTIKFAGHGLTHIANQQTNHPSIQRLAALLNQTGLETHLSENVDGLVWGKLAINAGINPLTALLRVPNGFLAENATARRIMQAAAVEAAQVAAALDIPLPYPNAAERVLEVAQATADNRSSMLQDVLRGAPTEIEAICGAVAANGRFTQTPTPINQQLLQLVQKIGNAPFTLADLQQILQEHNL